MEFQERERRFWVGKEIPGGKRNSRWEKRFQGEFREREKRFWVRKEILGGKGNSQWKKRFQVGQEILVGKRRFQGIPGKGKEIPGGRFWVGKGNFRRERKLQVGKGDSKGNSGKGTGDSGKGKRRFQVGKEIPGGERKFWVGKEILGGKRESRRGQEIPVGDRKFQGIPGGDRKFQGIPGQEIPGNADLAPAGVLQLGVLLHEDVVDLVEDDVHPVPAHQRQVPVALREKHGKKPWKNHGKTEPGERQIRGFRGIDIPGSRELRGRGRS